MKIEFKTGDLLAIRRKPGLTAKATTKLCSLVEQIERDNKMPKNSHLLYQRDGFFVISMIPNAM